MNTPTQGIMKNIPITKKNILFYLSILVIFILTILSIILLYPKKSNQASSLKSGDILIIVLCCFSLLLLAGIYFYLPNVFQNIWTVLSSSSYLIILIFYIFFVVVLYQNILTKEQVNSYAFITLPLVFLLAIFLFYMNLNEDSSKFVRINQSASQIKYSILYFCLILFLSSIFYINPNNYIKEFLGPYLVITILLCVFGFLYLTTLMSFPEKTKNTSLISRFNPYTIISVVIFIVFLVIGIVGIVRFPGGISSIHPGTKTGIIILFSLICIFWIISLGLSLFDENEFLNISNSYSGLFKKVMLVVFGLAFSGLLLYWLISFTQNLAQTSSIISFLLNLLIILAVLGLIFKILTATSLYENSPLTQLLVNTILYIPCIFVSIVDKLIQLFGLTKTYSSPNLSFSISKGSRPTIYLIYLAIIIVTIILYLIYPYIEEKRTNQGGLLLVNQPVYLNELKNLASYQTLNNIQQINLDDTTNHMQFNYNFAISFWTFLDSTNPSKVDQYTSVLNYGNKPNVLFNPMENTLLFTVNKTDSSEINNLSIDQLLEQGTQILYEHKDVALQKWNHIILQYNGGTFDIFINGKLAKSIIGVVPYKTLDILQIGTNNGIQGGICNVNYFSKLLTIQQIQNLYNFFKNKTPPVHSSSQDTIINVLEQIPNIVTNKPIQISSASNYVDTLNDKGKDLEKDVEKEKEIYIPENSYHSNFLSWEWYFKNNKY